jgi:NADH-quinone oxidoreductase subunit G
MSQDLVNLEVDGVPVTGRKGQMIIQVTDQTASYVPRFCYHEKLSVAANCRMCLVEVEKAPKPLPACATPIAEGMKVFTKSPRAIGAQRATMEFLLINHPLDCPICDQGGECELQDLAMGFGRDATRFQERKRVVKDKNLGPLVSTDMTRCIHCTRCVRFTAEIAGLQELGTTGRGEEMQIGTWVERSVDHELSANIIDLCPVGALNSKPFRYQGRAWEMNERALISPHDAVGSNLVAHVRRGRLMRVVPGANDAVNETWISDRDRFSYEGIYADDRLTTPLIRKDGALQPTDWQTALEAAAQGLKAALTAHGASQLGVLALPGATLEEHWLLARLARALGIANLDHRLRRVDFRDQDADPIFSGLGIPLTDVDAQDAILVIGADLRHEAPLLAHRVRTAAIKNRARVAFVNPAAFEHLFPVAASRAVGAGGMAAELLAIGRALAESAGRPLPPALAGAAAATAEQAAVAAALTGGGAARLVLLGGLAERHPAFSDLRAAAAAIAELAGAKLGYLPEGANAAGAQLAGLLPHRAEAGREAARGRDAAAMLSGGLKAYLLHGGVEPGLDTTAADAEASLSRAEFVLALTPFAPESVRRIGHVVLPIGTFAETSGTFVNLEGRWQSFTGAATPVGEARPGWKVLRVLGNLLGLAGFDYESSEAVRDELKSRLGATAEQAAATSYRGHWRPSGSLPGVLADVPLYQSDPIVRRAPSLQATKLAAQPRAVY